MIFKDKAKSREFDGGLLTECVGGGPKGGGGRRVNLLLDQDGRRRLVHRQLAVHCSREANTTVQVQLVNEIQGRQSRSKGRQGEVKQSNSESLNSLLTAEEHGVGLGDDDEGQRDEEESDDDD